MQRKIENTYARMGCFLYGNTAWSAITLAIYALDKESSIVLPSLGLMIITNLMLGTGYFLNAKDHQ